jgi:CrcB protein
MPDMIQLLGDAALVTLGAAVGTPARFYLSGVVARSVGETIPWGTFVVNVSGCLIMGIVAAVALVQGIGVLAAGGDRFSGQLHDRVLLRLADAGSAARWPDAVGHGLRLAVAGFLSGRGWRRLCGFDAGPDRERRMSGEKASPGDSPPGSPERWRLLTGVGGLYAAVVAGGILGSLARWLVALAIPVASAGFPWATYVANATGCLVIGFYAELTGPNGRLFAGPRMRQFVTTGFCGGYTTFSGFSVETLRFLLGHDLRNAAIYVASSVLVWLVSVWAGEALAGLLNE